MAILSRGRLVGLLLVVAAAAFPLAMAALARRSTPASRRAS
jgi:hypothetical protein